MAFLRTPSPLVSLALFCVLGCGESDDSGGPRAGTGGAAGDPGIAGAGRGGNAAGAAAVAGTGGSLAGRAGAPSGSDEPLLDRPFEPTYDCSITKAPKLLGINPWRGAALAKLGVASNALIRSEGDHSEQLVWSTIDVEGRLGTPRTMHDAAMTTLAGVTAAAQGDRTTVVWARRNWQTETSWLVLAQLASDGTTIGEPRRLTTDAGNDTFPKLVTRDDGYALIWERQVTETDHRIELALLGSDGALLGAPKTLVQAASLLVPDAVVAVGDHLAVAYSQYEPGGAKSYYLALDAAGQQHAPPRLLGPSTLPGTRLVVRGDRVLAAWTRVQGAYETDDVARVLRIGAFDGEGVPIGEAYDLQAGVLHQENVMPEWVDLGEDVGLAWSQGSVIYICAGCMPDNAIKFVILDGTTLTPKSDVVSFTNPSTAGGLLTPLALREGSDLLVTASVTYHVSAEAASATLRCSP